MKRAGKLAGARQLTRDDGMRRSRLSGIALGAHLTAMDLLHVDQHLLLEIARPATIMYGVLALLLLRRSPDVRLVVVVPVIGNIAAATYAAFDALSMILQTGSGGVITRSAAVAEALRLVSFGAATAAVLGGVVAFVAPFDEMSGRRTRSGSILLGTAVAASITSGALLWYLTRRDIVRLDIAQQFAFSMFLLNAGLCMAAIFVVLWPAGVVKTTAAKRGWFRLFAPVSAALAVATYIAAIRLVAFIARSAPGG